METEMNDVHQSLLSRIGAMIEQAPADFENAIKRLAFEANERIEVIEGEVVAWLGGERHALPIAASHPPDPDENAPPTETAP
jgi:hypothetical protein